MEALDYLAACDVHRARVFGRCDALHRRKSGEATPGAGCLYAVFMARPAIQRRLNAAVIILLQ
jgi:hypothetical protein